MTVSEIELGGDAQPDGRYRTRATVVVLAYNSEATLADCLATLVDQVADVGGELVVVDNASRDASAAIARDWGVEVVVSDSNLGFAGGCNLGASTGSGEVVVLVNPDSELDEGALAQLVATATEPQYGPVGGRAHHADGTFDRRCAMGRPRLLGALAFAIGLDTALRGPSWGSWLDRERGPDELPVDAGPVPVDAVSGAVMAVARDLWDRLEGLDEHFFVYGEDVDFCIRAAERDRTTVVATGAGYHHVGGMATDASLTRRVLLHRGKVDLYRRHLRPPLGALAVWCLQAGALARGLPSLVPGAPGAERSRPWLELFRARKRWRGGNDGARSRATAATT